MDEEVRRLFRSRLFASSCFGSLLCCVTPEPDSDLSEEFPRRKLRVITGIETQNTATVKRRKRRKFQWHYVWSKREKEMCKEQSNEEETDSEEPNTYWLGFCECCYSTIMEGSVLLSLVGCQNAPSNYNIPRLRRAVMFQTS